MKTITQTVLLIAFAAIATGCTSYTYTKRTTDTRVLSDKVIVTPDDPNTDATRNTKTRVIKEGIVIE